MKEHDLVSRMRRACVQKSMTGFRISGVFNTKDLIELGVVFEGSVRAPSVAGSEPGGSIAV